MSSAAADWRPTRRVLRRPARALIEERGEALTDFLLAAMRRGTPVRRPRDLAADLARHAREARRRLERRPIEDLAPLREAMERTLGLHFTGTEGEHFFRSSLVQTLFYGLFSGWMLWRQGPHGVGTFDWKDAGEYLALPLIGDLYEEIARPRRLADLDLREPIEWAAASLNHVDEAEFFKSFDADHAITLFYEPFLQAFDPVLRKDLGVWYTPHEIVQYMVGRVDQLLRSELGIADGLADENVYVLDPAAGTGSYLIEVARRIHKTLTEQGHGALAAAGVRKALTTRVFGFEILPAPYVVAHLQLGVTLRDMGTRLAPGERAAVFLTNALTGWESPKGAKQTIAFHFLQEEQEAATKVKREAPILVILGNPPYNGFAGVAQDEEADLIEPYKRDLARDWGVRRQLLDDLYVRFFRLAERKIGQQSPRGIVSYISNYSWLDGLSHPIMRSHVIEHFDQVWIDNCNGDKYKTGKRTPDGRPDQSMFTSDSQPVGIQVGTAITTLVRRQSTQGQPRSADVFYRDLWGFSNDKRAELLRTLTLDDPSAAYSPVKTSARQRWVLKDAATTVSWDGWPTLPELMPVVFKGVQPGRGGSLVSVDRGPLKRQMRAYFDPKLSHSQVREAFADLMADEARYDADGMRQTLLAKERYFDPQNVMPIDWLPFDVRWSYWEPEGKLLNEKRREFKEQVFPGNAFLACTQKPRKGEFPSPVVTTHLGSYYVFDPYTTYFPMVTRRSDLHGERIEPNIDPALLAELCETNSLPRHAADGHRVSAEALRLAEDVFYHVLAVLWSPAYRKENEAALRQDWPRVPVPTEAALLQSSAALGRQVADLLMPDRPVTGVTVGQLRPDLRNLAVPSKVGGGSIDEPADTAVDAGWGFRGQKNAVMCGRGRRCRTRAAPMRSTSTSTTASIGRTSPPKSSR